MNRLNSVIATILLLASPVVRAEKPPRNLAIFSVTVYRAEPEIDRVLRLTADQQTKLVAAYRATFESPALLELRTKASSKNPDDATRTAAQKEMRTARKDVLTHYAAQVATILTAEQQAVVTLLNEAAVNTAQKVDSDYNAKIKGAATEEAKTKLAAERSATGQKEIATKLREKLTADQIAALTGK